MIAMIAGRLPFIIMAIMVFFVHFFEIANMF